MSKKFKTREGIYARIPHPVPMSSIAEYFILGKVGSKLSEDFGNATANKSFSLERKSGRTEIDYTKDSEGNPITGDNPLYELSQALQSFREGEQANFSKEKINEELFFKSYLKGKGKHFVAGYLCNHSPGLFSKKKAYNLAYRVFEELDK